MNIEKYVSVNFNALVDVIDAVGGMNLELTDAPDPLSADELPESVPAFPSSVTSILLSV